MFYLFSHVLLLLFVIGQSTIPCQPLAGISPHSQELILAGPFPKLHVTCLIFKKILYFLI